MAAIGVMAAIKTQIKTRPLTEIRSDLRGAVHLAGVTAVTQEKFAKLLREAKAQYSPPQWKDLLAELSMAEKTATYYLSLKSQ
jgi:hypothetical protein